MQAAEQALNALPSPEPAVDDAITLSLIHDVQKACVEVRNFPYNMQPSHTAWVAAMTAAIYLRREKVRGQIQAAAELPPIGPVERRMWVGNVNF